MLSPDIQRDAITHHCESRGWTVLEWFTDIDLSGKLPPEKRPGLQELLSRSGECDMVVCYRVDRLSREPADYYAILAVLKEGGVGIDAAAQPKDPSPEGDFLWDLSAVLARYESLKLGARLKDMHKRLAVAGRWSGGVVPYGWQRVKDENGTRLVLAPDEAEWRRWMHERYWGGWSCLRIAKHLNEQAVPSRGKAGWTDGTVWNMLRSPYQVGSRRIDTGLSAKGNVEPLLSEPEYARTLSLMSARHTKRGRTGGRIIPSRLVRCGNCGGSMVAGSVTGNRGVYECLSRKRGRCERGTSIRHDLLLPFVEARLFAHLRGTRTPKTRGPEPDITPVASELDRVREALGRLALMRAEGTISDTEFTTARDQQRKRQSRLEGQLEQMTQRLEADARGRLLSDAWEDLGQLTADTWSVLSTEAKRDIVELVIEQIVVDPPRSHKPADLDPRRRVRIRWR